MQVARTLMPIPSAGPRSQHPCRRPHAEENGSEIDRNNHEGHAAQTKRISPDDTPQRKPRPCQPAEAAISYVQIALGRETAGRPDIVHVGDPPRDARSPSQGSKCRRPTQATSSPAVASPKMQKERPDE